MRIEDKDGNLEIYLEQMPSGYRYEDIYGSYMKVFEKIAHVPRSNTVEVFNPPLSWVPLLTYLSAVVHDPVVYFKEDRFLEGTEAKMLSMTRSDIEVLCGFRPETSDALWKVDIQWGNTRVKKFTPLDEFIITTNGGFHRPEVIDYINALDKYVPKKQKVVLVPCAADKPYPSKLHSVILDMMPDDFYMCNATGVLGLVPTDLWPIMPNYDVGIPYEYRLQQTVVKYFAKHHHTDIICYLDFYSIAVSNGLTLIGEESKATFVNTVEFYADYTDLMEKGKLDKLELAFKGEL